MPGEVQNINVAPNVLHSNDKLSQLLRKLSKDQDASVATIQGSRLTKNGTFAPAGSITTVVNLYEGKADRRGRCSWTATYPDDLEEPPENAESAQAALLVRNKKCYDGKRKLTVDSIVVQSPILKKVLGYVLEGYPGIQTTDLERLEFQAPFQPFVHRWERVLEVKGQLTQPGHVDHMNLFYGVLEEELRETLREKNDHVSHGIITFDNIWTIFEPGCIIYAREGSHERAFILTNGRVLRTQCGTVYQLSLKYVDYDGEQFGLSNSTINVPAFLGTRRIIDLNAYPLHFHPNAAAVKDKLIARGKLFESYKGFHFKYFDGITTKPGPFGPVRIHVDSRVIVDSYAFNRFNPNRKVTLEYIGDKIEGEGETAGQDDEIEWQSDEEGVRADVDNAPALTSEQHLLCGYRLRGYSLKDKYWLDFPINQIKDIVWNEHAFDSLVAPPEQKELILAFVQSQAVNKSKFDDVIQGKGKGIILLLSGPPGVGKTLTAESVAETMKVPLYSISAGDLGTESADVESSLSKILEMNQKWNSVLLLDESDVYLEARGTHDLERNKLVSIFLRSLEYYEGIMFLTTNRVDNIDAAFESRIHLSLQYDELDFSSRLHVWKMLLSRSKDVAQFTTEQLDKLATTELNGRQIKNILKTAHLLASKQETSLSFTQVDTVLRLRAANIRTA